jgi:hypothetical protein
MKLLDVIYLGQKSSDPDTTGLDDGSLYYNTTSHKLRILIAGVWTDVA